MTIAHVGNFSTGQEKISDTSLGLSSSALTLEAGNIGIAIIAADNVGTTTATNTSEVTNVTDTQGNTWTKIAENRYSETAAADGAVIAIWKCQPTVTLGVFNGPTVAFGSATLAKAGTVHEFSVGAGNDLVLVAGTIQYPTHNDGQPPSTSISTLPSKEYLFIRAIAGETNSTTALTPTSGYTAWTGIATSSGGGATNMAVRAEHRIVTTTGDTSAPTWVVSDGADLFVAFEETSPSAPAYDQDSFRFRNDDGSQTGASWVAALNTNANLDVDTTYRLRLLIQNTGTGAGTDVALQWQYNLASAGWNDITTSSSVVRAVASANFTDGDDCTQQLGAGTFHSNNDGMTEDGTAGGANLDLTNGQECETELSFQILSADVTNAQTLEFRISGLDTYTRTPVATVVEAGAGVNIPAIESSVFRRLYGRLFSFVN